MRIAITGATGLLGQELTDYFRNTQGTEVFPLTHTECDVTDSKRIRAMLTDIMPDILINCAVILNVDFCEENSEKCYAVNRNGVINLLEAARAQDRRLTFVQISSSEVFGRVHEGEFLINGYKEDDEARPASVYQKSKKEAEDLLLDFVKKNPAVFNRWFIIRAGWLYGKGRKTFVDQFLEKLQKDDDLMVVKDQWRSPT